MKDMIKGLFKYIIMFLIISGIMIFAGTKFRQSTLGVEMFIRDNIVPYIIGDTVTVVVADTILTANEELQLSIQERNLVLAQREDSLANLEQALADSSASLMQLRQQLATLQSDLEAEEDINLDELAKLYENMKPATAGEILLQLPEKTVVEILKKMKSREAAKIIDGLDPSRAADLIQRYRRYIIKQE